MINLIVGHRGSGKSNLLSYLQTKNTFCFDLDLKIQEYYKKSIEEIFSTKGEVFFRGLEKKVLYKIINDYKESNKDVYISIGAGFVCDFYKDINKNITNKIKVVWLQRKTDNQNRIFFNRPRLDKKKTPSQEYKDRFLLREKYYLSIADEVICLPEHIVEFKLDICNKQNLQVKNFFACLKKFIFLYFLTKKTVATKKTVLKKDNTSFLNKAGITLTESMFKNNQHIKDFLNKRLNWGVLFFEVRDDLISKKTFNLIKSIVPLNKLLLSLRDKKTYFTTSDLNKAWAWDWPIEKKLENCNFKIPFSIISLHSKKDNLSKSNLSKSNVSKQNLSKPSFSYLESQINLANKYNLKYKNSKKVHCKWSPTIESIESLQNLYTWFKKDSDNRSILPMSLSGRWDWFRLFLYGKIKINFIKENRNSFFKDQILLADKILTEIFTDKILTEKCLANKQTNFAAILGSPVSHSLTPFVHYDFFCDKKIPVYSILLNKNDITKNNVDFLIKLGLKYAAITSPLKKEFFNLKHLQIKLSHKAKNCKSINSLSVAQNKTKQNKTAQNKTKPNQITQNKTKQNQTKQNKTTQNKTKQNKIILDNTDQEGLAELIKSIFDNKNITTKDQKKIALWGSGGVSFMLSDAYPEICIFSSQQKKCISHNIIEKNYLPDIILWAVPGMYNSTPPKHWSPRHVVDLNYSQDSGGREYAILKNLDYTNGLLMFLSQAKEQQKLWNKN